MNGTQKPLDIDLNAEWEKACASFANSSKGKQLQGRATATPAQVAEAFTKKAKSSENSKKWEKLGTIAANTGFALLRLGEVASQAASMFFGPSQICMNAVSFFVDAALAYKKIFDTLEQLFEGISKALKRFEIYQSKQNIIDYGMKVRANMILLQLVSICDLSYKVLHKHNRFAQFAAVTLFKSDDGVGAALEALKTMTEDESQERSVYTYVSAKSTERNTEQLLEASKTTEQTTAQSLELSKKTERATEQILESSKKTEDQKERDKQIESLKKILGELDGSQNKQLRYCTSQAIASSGSWVADLEEYSQWSNLDQTQQSPLLLISGDEGCGKTFLVSRVVEMLKKQFSRARTDGRKVFVAYYYFGSIFDRSGGQGKGSNQGQNKDASRTVDEALRMLAMQLALDDEVYRQKLSNNLRNATPLSSNVDELWDILFVRSLGDASCFLILDDAHDLEKTETLSPFLKTIIEQTSKSSRIRVLVSARTELLKNTSKDLGPSQPILDIASSNQDMAKYVRLEVDKIPLLQDSSDQVKALQEEICEALGEIRSFTQIKFYLDLISGKQRPDEIREVLDKARNSDDMRDLIVVRLDEFNELPRSDVQDLNQILEWVICCFTQLSVEMLKEVLMIRRKENRSLKPIRARIKDDFSGLFNIEGDEDAKDASVSLRSETLKDHFRELTEQNKKESALSDTRITEMEVKIVQRFLKNLCDEELYSKFAFEDFFEKKLAQSSKVFVDTDEMHASVALDCMKIAIEEDIDDYFWMAWYVRNYWSDHLVELDISLVNQNLKLEIGKRLIPMLIDQDTIWKWLKRYISGYDLLCTDVYAPVLLKWIQESAVNRSCAADHLEWIKKLSIPPNNADEEIWRPVIKSQADQWLTGAAENTDWDMMNCFRWVRAFLNKVENRRNPDTVERMSNEDYWTDEVPPEDVEAAYSWATKELGVDSTSYLNQCRLGHTFSYFDAYEHAKDAYEAAMQVEEDNWDAVSRLAQTLRKLDETQEAIAVLGPAIKRFEEKGLEDQWAKDDIRSNLQRLAEWHRSESSYGEAMVIYEKLLKTDPNDYETVSDILTLLGTQGKHDELVKYLDTLKGETDEKTGRDRLSQLIIMSASDHDRHQAMVYNVRQGGYLGMFKDSYRKAIKHAEEEREKAEEEEKKCQAILNLVCLYFQAASSLHWYPENEEEKAEAVSLWEQTLALERDPNIDPDNWTFYSARRQAASLLCLQYLAQARRSPPDTEIVQSNLAKIKAMRPSDDDNTEFSTTYYLMHDEVALVLGYYHTSRDDKEAAMNELKPRVAVALEKLSDHDPSNDWQGFWELANVLIRYNDDANALAAISLITPTKNLPPSLDLSNNTNTTANGNSSISRSPTPQPPPDQKGIAPTPAIDEPIASTSPSAQEDDLPSKPPLKRAATSHLRRALPTGPMSHSCDGRCGTKWTYPSEMYICRQCPDVQFCPECHGKLRAGVLERHICDKEHAFLEVGGFDFERAARARKVGEGGVVVTKRGEEEVMEIEGWLDGIRKIWGIEKRVDDEKEEEGGEGDRERGGEGEKEKRGEEEAK